MEFNVGTGTATVRVTVKDGNIVRVETPYILNPLTPIAGPFYVEFNPGVPISVVNDAAAIVLALAGVS